MAAVTNSTGSSEGNVVDEKKRRRMESNRESARRSRQRKQQHLDDLIKEVGNMQRENELHAKKIEELMKVYEALEAENGVLRREKDRLVARLEGLENVIEIAKVVKGSNECLYERSDDPMMKPWQLPRPSFPIAAVSGGFRCFNFGA